MAMTRIRLERKVQNTMTMQIETGERKVVLLENAHIRPMTRDVLQPLPLRTIPYSRVDPFILGHDAVVPITEQRATLMEVRWCATGSLAGNRKLNRAPCIWSPPARPGRTPEVEPTTARDGGGQIP